jgi:hypothetical protein
MKPLAGDSGLLPDLDREHPAKAAIRRCLAHMGAFLTLPSAGRETSRRDGWRGRRESFLPRPSLPARRIRASGRDSGRRGQLSDIEIMMDSRINRQSDRRAIWPGMCDHFTAPLHRARFILLANQNQGRRRHRHGCRRDVTAGVIGDRGAKPLCEKLRNQVSLDSIERRKSANRIAEDGDPRRIDEIQLRQVAQRRVGIERLIEASDAATAGDAARAEAVEGEGHIPPGTQPIGDAGEMPGNPNAAVQHDNRRERSAAVGRAAELSGNRSTSQRRAEGPLRLLRHCRKLSFPAKRSIGRSNATGTKCCSRSWGRAHHVGHVPPDQTAATDLATKAAPSLSGVTSSRSAVNHLLKSVVREICTLRSVGTGGGRPPPVTRWMPNNGHPLYVAA